MMDRDGSATSSAVCQAFTMVAACPHIYRHCIGETAMAKRYKTYNEIRNARIADRRTRALAALDHAQEIASAVGYRLVVFGSPVEGGFHEASDIDVALFGDPAAGTMDAVAEVDTAPRLAGFSADVMPERSLPPSLRKRILDHGRDRSALGRRRTRS